MMRKEVRMNTSVLLLFVLGISSVLTPYLSAAEQITAIKGGDLYTITSGIIKDGTVLIEGDKISRIGQNIDIPKDAKVIEAKGKVVMPGLVAASAYGIAGYGSGKVADSMDPFSQNISLALAAGITTSFVSAGSTNAVIKTTYGDLGSMLVKEPIVESVDFSRSLWLDKTNFKESLRKAQAYLRKVDEYARAEDKKKLQEPKKPSGIDKHIRLLKHELPARLAANTASDLLNIAELLDEFQIDVIIEGAIEAWVVAEEIGRHDVLLIITPRDKRRPDEDISMPSGSNLENAAILRKAGLKFAIIPTSPSFATWGVAGRDLMALPMEAAFAVSGGLDEQTALESITITAAEILGVADRVGSLQVGKDADIIILDGHPFHHKTFVETTLVNGKVLYEKSKSQYFAHIKDEN